MTIIVQRDRHFFSSAEMSIPHKPTTGGDLVYTAQKAVQWLVLKSHDTLFAISLPKEHRFNPVYRFVDTTLNRKAKLFSQDNVLIFNQYLQAKFPNASIDFFGHGLGNNDEIQGSDPLFVIAGKGYKIDETEEEEWIVLNESPAHEPRRLEKEIIAYPFVFPPKGVLSLPHVVLIAIDRKEEAIYYYDPQGLTSDDPCRLGVFRDDPGFNLHENLVKLAHVLFPDKVVKLVENLSPHQIDPVNCGTLVCRALKRLYEGKPVEEALLFDQLVDSPHLFKTLAGHEFLQSLNIGIPSSGSIFNFQ